MSGKPFKNLPDQEKNKNARHLVKKDVVGVTAGYLIKMRDCPASSMTVGRSVYVLNVLFFL